ncbi:MAG: hypothetical protein K2O34_00815 [Acetatifactor sp.]|nr:hypothetical protein [Acetatifactor sp.]
MSNMYCNYKNGRYRAKVCDKKIIIISKKKQDGYDKYIDILGKEHDDLYMKEVDFNEVEVVYKEIIEIGYGGMFFQLFSFQITQSNIEDGRFMLFTSSEELAREYNFEKKEQFVFIKDISREQVEAIKIIQKPIKEFEAYGTRKIVIERPGIDEWLSSLE